MSVQTSYELRTGKAYAGGLYDLNPADIVTGIVESASIEFGAGVQRGTNDRQILAGGGGAANLFGISIRSVDREINKATGETKYLDEESAGVLRDGYVWVTCIDGCTPGATVFVNDTDGTFRATTSAGFTQATNCEFQSTAAAGELAVLKISN